MNTLKFHFTNLPKNTEMEVTPLVDGTFVFVLVNKKPVDECISCGSKDRYINSKGYCRYCPCDCIRCKEISEKYSTLKLN